MMPEGWKVVPLGSIGEFRNGINYDKHNTGQGVKVIGVGDFQDYTVASYHSLSQIDPAGVVSKDDLLRDGDILFVRSNGNRQLVGRSLLIAGITEDVTFSGFTIRLRLNSDQALPLFYAYFLKSPIIRSVFLKLGGGTNISNLSQQILKNLQVPLPPLPEQRRIADILGTWDRAIRLTEQRIAAQQQRKRALMQHLLTGRRQFREFAGSEWKPRKIASILAESRVSGSNGLSARKITVRLYGKGVVPKEEKLAGSEATKYYKRRAGQFIYSKLDFLNGAFGIIPPEMDGYESTLDLPCFDFKANIDPAFFLYLVSREAFYSRFETYALGGRKARRIQVTEFLSIEIAMPELAEQQRIAAVLQAADSELALLTARRAALQRQKHGLMQQLLTGRVRVPLSPIPTEEAHHRQPRQEDADRADGARPHRLPPLLAVD